jgi:photosystem I P700 chlorophyll a apoprotein A1
VPTLSWSNDNDSMLNHHVGGLFDLGSLAWAGHVIHVACPINKLVDLGLEPLSVPLPHTLVANSEAMNSLFAGFELRNFMGLNWAALTILSFLGGMNPVTASLWSTDIAHHHLAIAVVFLVAGHLYQTQFRIGTRLSDLLSAHRLLFINSWHAQLAINLAVVGSLSILFAHPTPAYPFIAYDHATMLSHFTHHMWMGGFFVVGGAAHAACFMVYDYQLRYSSTLDRVLSHKHSMLVHLNWVAIFLGMHSFGLYIHNDTMNALGRTSDMFGDTAIALQPIFAQWIQHVHLGIFGGSLPTPVWSHAIYSVDSQIGLMPVQLGTSDFLVHHIHAFTIHVTTLILLKGVLFARSSRLIPDKSLLGFRFPCDGPGRGGTCQVSAWDHVFLGLFWMYNSISVVIFHFSWKMQSDVWGQIAGDGSLSHITDGNFARSANTINRWLRDFLWSQSSQVVQSYGSNLSAYGLMFLGGHFVWSFSLMFLFSGRGYVQELIESIVWAHGQLNCAPVVSPRALSITQGRAVGLAHYLLGGIVTTWAFFWHYDVSRPPLWPLSQVAFS